MFNRFLGKSKEVKPKANLDDAMKSVEARGSTVDERIKALDAELSRYKQQLSKMRDGPAKRSVQQRAIKTLQQKKMYEKQRDHIYNQQYNIDQTKFATEGLKDTKAMVEAMKEATKEMKSSFKELDIDNIEDLHDDMSEMMEMNEEIQEVMGRAYGVPEELDEDDLMNELNALEEEVALEEAEEIPSYLVNAASAAKSEKAEGKGVVEVDDFGLPQVPVRNLA